MSSIWHPPTHPLTMALQATVPIKIHDLRNHPRSQIAEMAREGAEVIGSQGDAMLYRDKGTPAAFGALVRALAAAAYQPGGVTIFGQHWCVDHSSCQEDSP